MGNSRICGGGHRNDVTPTAFAALRTKETVVTSRAEQYRRLARDFHFMARSVPPREERSALLKMAEEWDWLADQQEQATKLRPHERRRII
jgi:hypothetical protein